LSTPLGVKLAEMAGLKERWNRVSSAERKKLLNTIFDILLPSKSLTKEQLKKGKHINKAMLSFRKMYNRFMQQNVENMPFKKKRGEMLLGINMLLDNIRIQLVSASTDKKSLDKKLDSLVSMIRIFNKTLTNQEKASIKKSNPYFARIIDNPESIKIFINGIKSIPKKAQNAAEFVSETSYAIKNSNEVKVLKRKIKYTKAKLTRLVSNYTTAVKRGVKSKAEKLKSQIHQNKKQLVYLALQLDKFDKTSSKLRNLTEMIRTESDSKKLDSLLKMFTETVLQGVPDKFKKAVSIDAYKELIKKPPKKILTKTQKICDKLMENNILSKICKAKIPYGRQFLFKSITLNEVLKKSPDKAGVKKIIFDAALKSLQGTDYIDKFRTMVGSTEFIDDKQKANRNLLNKLISKYVKRYI
jgi:hypothetical protein